MKSGMPGGKGTRKGFLRVNEDSKRKSERVYGERKSLRSNYVGVVG